MKKGNNMLEAKIDQVRKAADAFLKKSLNLKEVKIIKVAKEENCWKLEAEVYEESSFIKALGLQTKVQDRNVYEVKLNDSLEVESYGRKDPGKEE